MWVDLFHEGPYTSDISRVPRAQKIIPTFTFSFTHRLDEFLTTFIGFSLCLSSRIPFELLFHFLDSFSLLLRASVHSRLLRPYTLTFSVDFPRQSVMSAAKNAANLSTLGFSLHFFVSRSKFIESLSIRLEKWSQSSSLKLKPPPSVLNSR